MALTDSNTLLVLSAWACLFEGGNFGSIARHFACLRYRSTSQDAGIVQRDLVEWNRGLDVSTTNTWQVDDALLLLVLWNTTSHLTVKDDGLILALDHTLEMLFGTVVV